MSDTHREEFDTHLATSGRHDLWSPHDSSPDQSARRNLSLTGGFAVVEETPCFGNPQPWTCSFIFLLHLPAFMFHYSTKSTRERCLPAVTLFCPCQCEP
jgi:hypothetical protein